MSFNIAELQLSDQQLDFIRDMDSKVDWVEGTVRSGKTFAILIKYMAKVLTSRDEPGLNVIITNDTPTFERVILPEMEKLFPSVTYRKIGIGGAQVQYRGETILVSGYGNATAFRRVLGSTIKNMYLVEVNQIPTTEVFNKVMDRQGSLDYSYCVGDMNPSPPNHHLYPYINMATPQTKTPNQDEFDKIDNKERWKAYHFDFHCNPIMSEEKIRGYHERYPDKEDPIYLSSVLGIRSAGNGLIFSYTHLKQSIMKHSEVIRMRYKSMSFGVDTSFSQVSKDLNTIVVTGVTVAGKLVAIDEWGHKNTPENAITSSDLAKVIVEFARKHNVHHVSIESADPNTILECQRWAYKTDTPITFYKAYKSKTYGKIHRIMSLKNWFADGNVIISDSCVGLIDDFQTMVWNSKIKSKLEPKDGDDHYYDGFCYSWIPYRETVGIN